MKDIAARRGPSNMADSGTASAKPLKLSVSMDGPLVIECDEMLSNSQMAALRTDLVEAFPCHKVVVLTKGMRVSRCEQLRRIEGKLDALLEAMADEAEDEHATSLDEHGEARRPITL